MPNSDFFRPEFDKLATDGCIGDPTGEIAYAYIRVSGEEQADEGRSGLPRQIAHIHEAARGCLRIRVASLNGAPSAESSPRR